MNFKSTNGALVTSTSENGPAFKAGIKSGDIILEFNSRKIQNNKDLLKFISNSLKEIY